MSNCKDCKWSKPYFRGLLCYWVYENKLPSLPGYLKVSGVGIEGLESSYPFQLDQRNFPNCPVFESRLTQRALDEWDSLVKNTEPTPGPYPDKSDDSNSPIRQ